MPSRIDTLLQRQAVDLASLEERQVRAMLRALEDARRDLREQLEALHLAGKEDRFTAQHVRVMLAQVSAGVDQLKARLGDRLSDQEQAAHDKALRDLLAVIRQQEPGFADAGGRIETAALRRLTEERGLLLHRYSVERYGAQLVEAIQQELVR